MHLSQLKRVDRDELAARLDACGPGANLVWTIQPGDMTRYSLYEHGTFTIATVGLFSDRCTGIVYNTLEDEWAPLGAVSPYSVALLVYFCRLLCGQVTHEPEELSSRRAWRLVPDAAKPSPVDELDRR